MKNDLQKLRFQQRLTFLILFLGYTMYMMCRKSFAFNIPSMKQTENLDAEAIGSIISSLAVGYAIGKFASGILVDSYSPKYLFSAGLVICGGINLAFSASTSTSTYAFLWFANGIFQGFGWPSCAKLLKRWYSPVLFGTLWSLLSASMNVAASIGPFFCNAINDSFGSWRYCMQVFGTISILSAAFVLLFIHDEPMDCGFSTNNIQEMEKSASASSVLNTNDQKSKTPLFAAMKRIFASPFLYVMAVGFLTSLLCKGVISDWGPLYLITEKNATKTMASAFSGTMEVGGIAGNVLSGIITDWISASMPQQQRGNPRNYYMIPCIVILTVSMMLLRTSIADVSNQYLLTLILAFSIGFCCYSLLSIVGVMTIERSANDISGASHAVAALFGNVGLAMSGLPFSMVVEKYSWSTAFFLIECCLVVFWAVAAMSQGIICRIGDKKRKSD